MFFRGQSSSDAGTTQCDCRCLSCNSKVAVDGIYGPATAASVRKFQSVFGLPETEQSINRTWYKISEIYVGVSRIAELV